MRHRNFISLLLVLFVAGVLAGCASSQLRESLVATELTYQHTVQTAIELRELGVIEPGSEREQRLTEAFAEVNTALQMAHDFLTDNKPEAAREMILDASVKLKVIGVLMGRSE